METLFLVLAVIFTLIMLVILLKYANFIHRFPHPEKDNSGNKQNDSAKKKQSSDL